MQNQYEPTCNIPCYECKLFQPVGMKIEKCRDCKTIRQDYDIRHRISGRNWSLPGFIAIEDPNYEPPYASKFSCDRDVIEIDLEALGYETEKDFLVDVYPGKTINEISKITGCSFHRIKKKLKKYGIALRTGMIGENNPTVKLALKKIDKAVKQYGFKDEKDMLLNFKYETYDSIKEKTGISQHFVRKRFKMYGIPRTRRPGKSKEGI